jgi:hypothetical protein
MSPGASPEDLTPQDPTHIKREDLVYYSFLQKTPIGVSEGSPG